ncbi:MAG: hypothetical protein JHD16_01215 [Solirubrobacteraceae bacterium]|nr:hypothetical protein [Solirubrobacteraceae bacterium]
MSRTVITEDDLAPDPPPATGEHAAAGVPPAPAPPLVGSRHGAASQLNRAWMAGVAVLAILAIGGAFLLGQASRPSEDEVAGEVRDAIREVRDGMRAERAAITKRALERQRIALRVSHRRELAALRKRYGIPAPTAQAKAPVAKAPAAVQAPTGGGTSGGSAPRAPSPPPAPTPNPEPKPQPNDQPTPNAIRVEPSADLK